MKTPKIANSIVSTAEVIDVSVKNKEKKDLGKIEEIILDKVSGNIRYVVLSFGGILGIGNKLFAVPWNAINYNVEENAFILDVEKEILKKAPGFEQDNPPNYADQKWGKSIYEYYQTKPYWE